MKKFNAIFYVIFVVSFIPFQLTVGQQNGIYNERIADFLDDYMQGSGDVDVPFIPPEDLEDVKKINLLESIRDSNLDIDANEDEEDHEAITKAQLIFQEVVDTGEDEVKVAGAAMNLFEEIKEIPKEIHDSLKDSAKKVWNKGKKISGHVMKLPNQVSDIWKKSSPATATEDTSNGKSGFQGGLFGFRRFG